MTEAQLAPTVTDLHLDPLLVVLKHELGQALVGVVLYGSHARGTARPDSDIDLLVIASELPESRVARADFFVDLQFEAGYPYLHVSILGKTVAEFEGHFPALYLDIGLDGIVLFDRDGYLAGKLARIRALIEEADLLRRQLDGDFLWQFTHPVPPASWSLEWEGYREFPR